MRDVTALGRGRRAIGTLGEQAAADYLARAGYQIIKRNYRCRAGEVDIVARDGHTLVFVEVRTRTGASFGLPEESITAAKGSRMVATALTYLAEQGEQTDADAEWRVDLIAVDVQGGRVARLRHVKHALQW
jgi:putative endonuclease